MNATEPIKYPEWICFRCGQKWGRNMPSNRICTFHEGECGICKDHTVVTEPRDYGHLRAGWQGAVVSAPRPGDDPRTGREQKLADYYRKGEQS